MMRMTCNNTAQWSKCQLLVKSINCQLQVSIMLEHAHFLSPQSVKLLNAMLCHQFLVLQQLMNIVFMLIHLRLPHHYIISTPYLKCTRCVKNSKNMNSLTKEHCHVKKCFIEMQEKITMLQAVEVNKKFQISNM